MLRTLRKVARRVIPRRFRRGRGTAHRTNAFAAVRALDGPVLVPRIAVRVEAGGAREPRLVILIPTLELHRLTGGPNTALSLGAEVAARGRPVRFVATHGPASAHAELLAHVGALTGRGTDLPVTFESVATSQELGFHRGDVVLATWWPTAHVAARAIEALGVSDFLYLIQDFEPAFYPWSTNYALALQTYAMPMRAICNTSLLRDHLVEGRIGRFATAPAADISITFEPAVDRRLFRRRPATGPRRLLFYTRPGKARNAFELGLAALRGAVQAGGFTGDWEYWAIGEPVPELALGSGATLRPMPWRSLADYGELLGTSDVLLSLMLSPHPSYPPLEMAAAGGRVVTNTFGVKTAAAMADFSPLISAVAPDVELLAAALATASEQPRPDQAPAMALPATWRESLAPTVDWILSPAPERR